MYAEVIVDILNSEVDKVFDYAIPPELDVRVGSRVTVPFAHRKTFGIVMSIKQNTSFSEDKVKAVLSVLDEMPALSDESIVMAKYIAKKYFTTTAQVLRLFLPSEMRRGTVKESFKRYALLTSNYKENLHKLTRSAKKQSEIISYLEETTKQEVPFLAEKFGRSSLNSLVEKEIVYIIEEKVKRTPYEKLNFSEKNVTLVKAQEDAIKSVKETDKLVTLIFGVTGSGKTEVYMNLIREAISLGKTAVMLVPEIALTPQMLKELRSKFGDTCAILHSGLSAGEKFDEWWRLRTGEARIAIGARSAIFAPVENVGIIIIDEEHDSSYQSESSPRYNTLDLAVFRAKYNNSKVVVGSATPSIETYLKATDGEYNLVKMPERINKRPMPHVDIVDMKNEVRRGNSTIFSRLLREEISSILKNKKQAIIFLNQRGYSKSVICTDCGFVPKCEACDVSLTYHSEENVLKCHYCNTKYKMIDACPECGSKYLRYGGIGTERVVSELKKLFPEARILRMDRDTTANKEGHFNVLTKFAEKEGDILVGTQMIAKGHDFPAVTLVGILDADMSLYFSDYRSAERTFQLITQVAGRSGRSDDVGKVVLQTYQPDNRVINYAVSYQYEKFFETESSLRKSTGFPPYTDIIRLLVTGEDEEKTIAVLKQLFDKSKKLYDSNRSEFKFFGCMKAPIKRLQNKFRYQILMRINANSKIKDEISLLATTVKERGVYVSTEINPNNLT